MKQTRLLLILSVILSLGCGDQANQDQAPSPEQPRESSPVSAPADYVGAVLTAQQSAQVRMHLIAVNEAVKGFHAMEGRLPRNLQELVENNYLPQVPELPTGLSFQFNPQTGEVTVPR